MNTLTALTIIVPSYNRGQYIKETLDSIFAQKTNYVFNVVIADDASTDDTLAVVQEYQVKYPDMITVLTSEKNQRLYRNISRVYKNLTTEYFTVLDPDDYWTDTQLLQKALDFLEKNKDFTIYTANICVTDGETSHPYNSLNPKIAVADSSFENYLIGEAVLSCTQASFYRNKFSKTILKKMDTIAEMDAKKAESFRGDSFRNIIHIHEGKCHFENKMCATYRITDIGIWQKENEFSRNNLNTLFHTTMYEFYDKKYPELLFRAYKLFIKNQEYLNKQITDNRMPKSINETNLENYFSLLQFFLQNPVELDIKKEKIKTRIGLKMYKFLKNKLLIKGILYHHTV